MHRRSLLLSIFVMALMTIAPGAGAAAKKLPSHLHFAQIHAPVDALEEVETEATTEPAGLALADSWERTDNGWKRR